MSNWRAIEMVTATLALQIVQKAVEGVPNVHYVKTDRPGTAVEATDGPYVNVYLYQVVPNAARRNIDLPTRDCDGRTVQRPRVALDLHYLLTFYGDESRLEPQHMAARVALAMQATPVLTPKMIGDTVSQPGTDTDTDTNKRPDYSFLADSNLADEVELVKLTPLPLSLEELSKMWSGLFQTKYVLSMTYEATAVLIEGQESPRPALPVLEREIFVAPFRQPTIERIRPQAGEAEPIIASSTLVIEGQQLRGEVTQIRIGGSDLALVPVEDVSDGRIIFPLTSLQPAGSLRAGMQGAQIVQPRMMGRPRVAHVGVESNVFPLVIRPQITDVSESNSTKITIMVDPTIGKTQRVLLLLNEITDDTPEAYTFVVEGRDVDANKLTIPISGVKASNYFLRVQVDGAESMLQIDDDKNSPTFHEIIAPRVTIP